MNIDEEQEYYQLNQVDLYLAQNKCGTGNLVLTNKRIRWIPSAGDPKEWNWRSVVMHAISKDSTHFPYASIYCQIHIPKGSLQSELYSQQKQQNNNNDAMEQDKSEEEEDTEPTEDVDEFLEVRFVPPTEENLEVLFSVFSKGAQMNPDPVEEDEGDFYFNPNIINNLNAEGNTMDQFQDADDDDKDNNNDQQTGQQQQRMED